MITYTHKNYTNLYSLKIIGFEWSKCVYGKSYIKKWLNVHKSDSSLPCKVISYKKWQNVNKSKSVLMNRSIIGKHN